MTTLIHSAQIKRPRDSKRDNVISVLQAHSELLGVKKTPSGNKQVPERAWFKRRIPIDTLPAGGRAHRYMKSMYDSKLQRQVPKAVNLPAFVKASLQKNNQPLTVASDFTLWGASDLTECDFLLEFWQGQLTYGTVARDNIHTWAHLLTPFDAALHGKEFANAVVTLVKYIHQQDEALRIGAAFKDAKVPLRLWSPEAKERSKERAKKRELTKASSTLNKFLALRDELRADTETHE